MPTTDLPSSDSSRLEAFNSNFALSLAMTRSQRDQVYQLRYRVYCEEFGYEPTSEFSNDQEMDEFDCQSIHCMATHRQSGILAGCVRVVMVEGKDRMPMEAHAGDSIDRRFINTFRDQRDTLCEISRLAVDGRFRRRRRERDTRFGNMDSTGFNPEDRRTFPLIALVLILGAGAVADALGRKNCFAIMEPSLPLMMRRAGIDFRRVGADFEFRGVRAPYYGNINELIDSAPLELRDYFNRVREHFVTVLHPARVLPARSRREASVARGAGWPGRPSLSRWGLG